MISDKQGISILTENILYKRIQSFDNDQRMDKNKKEQYKKEATEFFVKEMTALYTNLSFNEVRCIVNTVLERTAKRLKGEER